MASFFDLDLDRHLGADSHLLKIDKLPDETTFCRFRNKLIESGKFEKLFNKTSA